MDRIGKFMMLTILGVLGVACFSLSPWLFAVYAVFVAAGWFSWH